MLDTPDQLLQKIRLGEDSFLECKEVVFAGGKIRGPRREELTDELAAFANGRGGVLVLGVADKSLDVVGIPASRLQVVERYVAEIVRDSIEPPLDAVIEFVELPDAKGQPHAVVRIQISRSAFVHKSPSGYFRRVGSSKREVKSEELSRLFQQRSQAGAFRFDEQILESVRPSGLMPDLIRRFRTAQTQDADAVLAEKLGLLRTGDNGLRATIAGALFGAARPDRWLPHAYIQAVAYRGGGIGESGDLANYQLDAKDIFGPLDAQIAEACKFVARNQKVGASKFMGRVDHPQYDMTAVFEALVNAVAHRDYSMHGSKIRLRMFADRLELYSPGELPNTLTLDALAYRQATRNETITSLLARMPVPDSIPSLESPRRTFMDRRGEGVGQILARSKELCGKEPIYDMPGGAELRLTIFSADPAEHYDAKDRKAPDG